MILRTDLYAAILHEDRLQKNEARAQGSIWKVIVGFSLALLTAGGIYYYCLQQQVEALRPQASAAKARLEKIQRDLQGATERTEALRDKVARRDVLMRFAKNRLSWAPIMEAVFQATPGHIELTTLKANCSMQQKCTVRVRGRTATRNSRLDCDKYRLLLTEALGEMGIPAEAKFISLAEVESGVPSGNAYLSTVFEIELSWTSQPHGK